VRVSRRVAIVLALWVVAGLGVGARVWWMEGGKYLFEPRKWGVGEEDGFYRSGQVHRRLVEDVLREHRIDLIVDLASGDPGDDPDEAAERAAAERLGIPRLELRLPGDGRGHADRYVTALAEVLRARRAGRRVWVHCNAGRERTGALVAMYRMLEEGWDGARAYEEYVLYRKHPPRRRRLQRYLEENLPYVADALSSQGLVAHAPDPLPSFGPAVSGGPSRNGGSGLAP
jgi:hypothetical protein